MSSITLQHKANAQGEVHLPLSKSLSNRWLVLSALYGLDLEAIDWGDADDIRHLKAAFLANEETWSMGLGGTAIRFGLAAAVILNEHRVITGEQRLLERPIYPLVDALRSLGARINYLGEEGYPPVEVLPSSVVGGIVEIDAGVSSQFLSAIALIAPFLPEKLEVTYEGQMVSRPYFEMTLSILKRCGLSVIETSRGVSLEGSISKVEPELESDWSAASYFYSMVALGQEGASLFLHGLRKDSLQGDARVMDIYRDFGVESSFERGGVLIYKTAKRLPESIELDLNDCPDLAQTIAVTSAGLDVEVVLSGLQTLKIKETNRLIALKTELAKFEVDVELAEEGLRIKKGIQWPCTAQTVDTYDDHRMAMAFAALCVRGSLSLKNPEVVTKSFPKFWEVLSRL